MAQPQGPLAPGVARVGAPPKQRRRPSGRAFAVVLTIVAATLLLYLQPVYDLGFYYDDWAMLSVMDDVSGGYTAHYDACRSYDPSGRFGNCLYHAAVNVAFGRHPWAYHLLGAALVAIAALLLYAFLRRCRLPLWPALVAALLFVVYPGSDSTRLWAGGLAGAAVLACYLGAVLLAIEGLRRKQLRWHVLSTGLFVLLLFTYEVVVPPIAIAGLLYLVAVPDDRGAALRRGATDLALAVVFVFYRLVIDPVPDNSGFVEHRDIGQLVDRIEAILRGAWSSFKPLFLPGSLGTVALYAGVLVCVAAMANDRAVLRASVRWLVAATVAIVFAAASVLAYVTANDYYVPDRFSLFDRLNLIAAPAYCVLFVALCGLLWTALRHWLAQPAATAIVAVLLILVGASQIRVERSSQEAWAISWTAQTAARKSLRAVAPQLDRNASVMSFGHPIWERGFIPVIAAGWDLSGMIAIDTPITPSTSLPFTDDSNCGPVGVRRGETPFIAYRGGAPLWFVNLSTSEARRIGSKMGCEAAIKAWGRPPFWGKSVTG